MAEEQREWYYRNFDRSSAVEGPFTLAELMEEAEDGLLTHGMIVRRADGDWIQADRVQALIPLLRHKPEPTAAPVNRENRRHLNWFRLFVMAILLSIVGGILMTLGAELRVPPFLLIGVLLGSVASILLLVAIVRCAIDPLFGQMVDANDYLKEIAERLKPAEAEEPKK